MDQYSVVVTIYVFAINQIRLLEAILILVPHIIYQMNADIVEMQTIFWLEIIINGQQLRLKSIKFKIDKNIHYLIPLGEIC
jgi:hypothetical protein